MAADHTTLQEMLTDMKTHARSISSISKLLSGILSSRDSEIITGVTYANINTDVTGALVDALSMKNRLATALSAEAFDYADEIKIQPEAAFNFFEIDVLGGGANGVIYARESTGAAPSSGAPFSVFADGDTVEITRSSDADNNGLYVIDAAGAADYSLTLTTVIGGANVAEATRIILINRDQ